ncbi:REC104-like protein [Saccharomyces kudriavzevii IFO 1802]|uniref:REC104-like protein n=2 Tax=Saccharomyces kudriavzevii (strain ATCC MYA-4449 / AS 2.2408 / CBS 8840 / NBRC 1802 / NCYC 2889) TaxID=226230 RepID=J4TYQ6_SACK1|nr:REC104-like protein [Saccharomyces kudriavzevii IFO 1802]
MSRTTNLEMSIEKEEGNRIICMQDFLRQYFVSESVSIQFGLNNKTVRRINEEEFNKAANCIITETSNSEVVLKRTASNYILNSCRKKPTLLSLPFIIDDSHCMSKVVENNNDTSLLYSDTLYGDDSLTQRNEQIKDVLEDEFSFTLLQSEANEMMPVSSSSTPQILQSDYSAALHEAQASNGSIFQFSSP